LSVDASNGDKGQEPKNLSDIMVPNYRNRGTAFFFFCRLFSRMPFLRLFVKMTIFSNTYEGVTYSTWSLCETEGQIACH
jgi:hypothetical protein